MIMKGAPEKIYLDPALDALTKALSEKTEDDVEYTRTDVFIDKACDAYCKVCGHFAHSVPTHICRHDCRYFSDFKNYMKGE